MKAFNLGVTRLSSDTAAKQAVSHSREVLRRLLRPSAPTLLAAWLLAALTEYALLDAGTASLSALACLREMSLLRLLSLTAVSYVLLSILPSDMLPTRRRVLLLFVLYASLTLCRSFSAPLLFACLTLTLLLIQYVLYGYDTNFR